MADIKISREQLLKELAEHIESCPTSELCKFAEQAFSVVINPCHSHAGMTFIGSSNSQYRDSLLGYHTHRSELKAVTPEMVKLIKELSPCRPKTHVATSRLLRDISNQYRIRFKAFMTDESIRHLINLVYA